MHRTTVSCILCCWQTNTDVVSLAMAEMRCLLKGVYSRFRTTVAPDMMGRMTLSDQIISSRPLDQTCKLVFEPRHDV
jgi:hypothetical protein